MISRVDDIGGNAPGGPLFPDRKEKAALVFLALIPQGR
jgi:hypothetical protein